MLKSPESVYKHGRTTAKENIFWKAKFWNEVDAVCVGFTQGEELSAEARNDTSARDAFGNVKRDHKKENRVKVERVGSVQLAVCEGQVFPEGARFNATFAGSVLRNDVTWENRERYLGRVFTVEYQDNGKTDLPRFGRITRMR